MWTTCRAVDAPRLGSMRIWSHFRDFDPRARKFAMRFRRPTWAPHPSPKLCDGWSWAVRNNANSRGASSPGVVRQGAVLAKSAIIFHGSANTLHLLVLTMFFALNRSTLRRSMFVCPIGRDGTAPGSISAVEQTPRVQETCSPRTAEAGLSGYCLHLHAGSDRRGGQTWASLARRKRDARLRRCREQD